MTMLARSFSSSARFLGGKALAPYFDGRFGNDHPNAALLRRLEKERVSPTLTGSLAISRRMTVQRIGDKVLEATITLRTREDLRIHAGLTRRNVEMIYPMLLELFNAPDEPAVKVLINQTQQLDWVGPVMAQQLVKDHGATSVQNAAKVLSRKRRGPSKLALETVQMLETVSCDVAEQVLRLLQRTLEGTEFTFHLAGRHRRLQQEARQIVIVVSHKRPFPTILQSYGDHQISRRTVHKGNISTLLMDDLISPLSVRGIVHSSHRNGFHGFSVLVRMTTPDETRSQRVEGLRNNKGSYVLVELVVVPEPAIGAALIFHTGDSAFLRMCEVQAERNMKRLLGHGLYRLMAGEETENIEPSDVAAIHSPGHSDAEKVFWQILPTHTERQAFEQLGLEYLSPSRRNFNNVIPTGATTDVAVDLTKTLAANSRKKRSRRLSTPKQGKEDDLHL
ncbi:hypothetical protein BKA62DRAFT_793598 [Auriculariales sp. MPI-PUGE-AT-0066]|nr:hypothetical protein BKA62DRAFT_793598 [Auriculariales sp. MPI-PUGE-AT-0066]